MCVDGFIFECPLPPPPPPSVYLALRAYDQVRRFINIHLHYITLHYITLLLNLFDAEMFPKRSWRGQTSQRLGEGKQYLTLHSHHENDCTKSGRAV